MNRIAFLKRNDHPGNRSTFAIEGVKGRIVIHNDMFADGVAPASIELNVDMKEPSAKAVDDTKALRAKEAAERAETKAAKAQERVAAQAAKAQAAAEKAQAALAKAQAKVAPKAE